jgi:hypothetical protein
MTVTLDLAKGGQTEVAAETGAAAQAEPSQGTDTLWMWGSFALVIASAVAGWALFEWRAPAPFKPGPELSLFAPMYILAQSIERLLEPFTQWLGAATDTSSVTQSQGTRTGKKEAKKVRDEAVANTISAETRADAVEHLSTAAKAQELVDRIRRNRTYITWGIASALAMVASRRRRPRRRIRRTSSRRTDGRDPAARRNLGARHRHGSVARRPRTPRLARLLTLP